MYVFVCVCERKKKEEMGKEEEGNEVENIDKDSDYVTICDSVCFSYLFFFTTLLLLLFACCIIFWDIKNACHTSKVNLKLTGS